MAAAKHQIRIKREIDEERPREATNEREFTVSPTASGDGFQWLVLQWVRVVVRKKENERETETFWGFTKMDMGS